MRFGVQLCALAFSAMLSISIMVIADEEVEEIVMMEEVIVTAQKREQRSFDVPLSISTLQGEKSAALRSSGMDVRFLSNRVPQLANGILVWACLSALLYPWSGQYGL